MIRINLLPKELQDKGKGQDWIILAYGVLVIFAFAATGFYFSKRSEYNYDTLKKERWSAQLSEIKAKVAQVEQLDAQKNALSAKKSAVVQLFLGRLLYPKFMESFYATLPADVWVREISLTEDPGSKNITITALSGSLSTEAIASWLETLESKPDRFSGVTLSAIEVRPSPENRQTTYEFAMTFTYVPPPVQLGGA